MLDLDSIVKMITLLFPCSLRKVMPVEIGYRGHLAQVFRENNKRLRQEFFSEPLIKHLWSKIFIVEGSDIVIDHMRRIRSAEEQGEEKYFKICRDMAGLEVQLRFKMLPDSARVPELVQAFSEDEKKVYLLKNAKFNKRANWQHKE